MPLRSRGPSDFSNISCGSAYSGNNTSHTVAGPRFMGRTVRQPYAPPENSRLQQHEGFARFLKQHASPPHNRVTAGGRIVPAGPMSPPPMLDFGSLNGLVRERPAADKPSQQQGSSGLPTARNQAMQMRGAPVTFGEYLSGQGNSIAGQGTATANSLQSAMPLDNVTFSGQPFAAPLVQPTPAMTTIGMLPDGSTLVFLNGMYFRAYWNGMNVIMEPFPVAPPYFEQQSLLPGYQHPTQQGVPDGFGLPVKPRTSSAPLGATTNSSRSFASKSQEAPQNESMNKEDLKLKEELTSLDRHLALYHFEITPSERATMVARRKYLVEAIDKIRVSKEQSKHSIPIIAPAARRSIKPVAPSISISQRNPSTRMSSCEPIQKSQATRHGTSSKYLSPAALPFVPKCMQYSSTNGSQPRTVSGQTNQQEYPSTNATAGGQSLTTAPGNANVSAKTDEQGIKGLDSRGRVSCSEASPSSVLDPSDPAMRVIEYEDIEYAARYLYNYDKDKKTYCTIVPEFQEAVRRVREQARLYGCKGGQSKDPAYDAEQDLWWAICDRDPIPLPTKIPDHVSKPRPWNWDDSAFNFRSRGQLWEEPAATNARASPRVRAWDPIMTEMMKDTVDVSRSYYALKGQLPSVPFRDFVYDLNGNKVKIESDTIPAPAVAPKSSQKEKVLAPDIFESGRAKSVAKYTVKALSSSDLIPQSSGPALNSKAKHYGKENVSDFGHVVGLTIRTPEGKYIYSRPQETGTVTPSKHSSPDQRTVINTMETTSVPKQFQAYVEDCPDTPARARTGRNEMKAMTPQMSNKNSFSTFRSNHGSGTVTDKPAQSLEMADGNERPTTYSANVNGSPKIARAFDPWFDRPMDEITLEYLTNLGIKPERYSPIVYDHSKRPDGTLENDARSSAHKIEKKVPRDYEDSSADVHIASSFKNHDPVDTSHDYEVDKKTAKEFAALQEPWKELEPPNVWTCLDWEAEIKKQANARNESQNHGNPFDPVAESKSSWGPEDDAESWKPLNVRGLPQTHAQPAIETPKVKIPVAPHSQAATARVSTNKALPFNTSEQKAIDSSEVKSINIPRQVNSLSNTRAY